MEMNLIVNMAIALVAIISLIWMWKNGYRKQVREMLLILVIQAEKAWGRGTGEAVYRIKQCSKKRNITKRPPERGPSF